MCSLLENSVLLVASAESLIVTLFVFTIRAVSSRAWSAVSVSSRSAKCGTLTEMPSLRLVGAYFVMNDQGNWILVAILSFCVSLPSNACNVVFAGVSWKLIWFTRLDLIKLH